MHPLCFQGIILNLQTFWARQGCVLLQPYDMEVGAGTFHPDTVLRALGPQPWRAAFVQPSRRPADGRYGDNPNRVQRHHQFQVVLKPSPSNIQDLTLESFQAIGFDMGLHDIRFVEDDWASPTLGATGLGWEVWCDGMEVLQFTYFQQIGGMSCDPVTVELTYGLERIAMNLQACDDVYALDWNGAPGPRKVTYGDVYRQMEIEFSHYNFTEATLPFLEQGLSNAVQECQHLLDKDLSLPAYDQCLHASHFFNLLDARGALSVAQRAHCIAQVRDLARGCMESWVQSLDKPCGP